MSFNPSPLTQALLQSMPTPNDPDNPDNPFDGLTPADIPARSYEEHHNGVKWSEYHRPEREAHGDPTFRAFLATNSHSPADPKHRRPKAEKPQTTHPLASLPIEDTVMTFDCLDGAIALDRRSVLILYSALHTRKSLKLSELTVRALQAIIDGWGRL
jgi:hypothetical protein